MAQKISRRSIVRTAAIAAAVATSPIAGAAQQSQEDDLDRRLSDLEKQLAKPLSPEAMKIAKTMLNGVDDLTSSRMKQKLPENSEPCFTYVPTAVGK